MQMARCPRCILIDVSLLLHYEANGVLAHLCVYAERGPKIEIEMTMRLPIAKMNHFYFTKIPYFMIYNKIK